MTTILDEIVTNRRREVAEQKELYPMKLLERSMFFETECVSLREYLGREDRVGIIAEIKRRSPSKGFINRYVNIEQLSVGYMQAGASALSILTEEKYFGGTSEDLKTARRFNYCPILRKDFIVDEYQIVEAKSLGADVVLLIAAALAPDELKTLAQSAKTLGLEVLLEIHERKELEESLIPEVDLIGVNNRDLRNFSVDIERSLELVGHLPKDSVKVSESGISDPGSIRKLKEAGYRGFLIGETFMSNSRPDIACRRFIEAIEREG